MNYAILAIPLRLLTQFSPPLSKGDAVYAMRNERVIF